MRAKILNEIQNFEKGQDPKKALDLGGIVPSKKFYEIFKKAKQEWYAYIKELLEGKTISGDIRKFNPSNYHWEPISYPIKVTLVKYEFNSGDGSGIKVFTKSNNDEFYIAPGSKIYIKE